jgi:hypothetical protein
MATARVNPSMVSRSSCTERCSYNIISGTKTETGSADAINLPYPSCLFCG